MSDETMVKLARVDTGIATINRLIISTMATLARLPSTVDEFVKAPSEENVADVENALLACNASLDGIRGYLSQVASDVLGVEPEPNEEGQIEIQAMSDAEGIRLK
jgi:predicted AAA+ superfamily ATPase